MPIGTYQPDQFYIPSLKRTLRQKNFKSGATSSYYRLSPTLGIKIFNFPVVFFEGGRKTLKELKKAPSWKMAKSEIQTGKAAYRRFKNACKLHKLTYVKSLLDGQYYPAILLEHVQGPDLCDLSFNTTVYIGKFKTCAGLAERDLKSILKSKGLVHQDMNSGNVLVSKRGNLRQVMIIDFGYFTVK